MGKIFVTTYEVVGDGVAIAQEHEAEIEAAHAAQWAFVESVNGDGFRPGHDGGVRSIFFRAPQKGWRRIGAIPPRIEAAPRKNSVDGKAIAAQMAALPHAPQASNIAAKLGYNPNEMAIDEHRGTIYFPSYLAVSFPVARYFVRLPRFAQDGFEPDQTLLRAMPESEFMKVLEDHNDEARRLKEAA